LKWQKTSWDVYFLRYGAPVRGDDAIQIDDDCEGNFYKPAAWANLSVPVLAVHWVRVRSSLPTSPARDGF
jgi:hypothetical protein